MDVPTLRVRCESIRGTIQVRPHPWLQPCARQDAKPCRHPHDVRVSLEAVGFNLGKTTSQLLGIDLKWGGKDRLPEYITLVTALLTNDAALRLE